MSYKNFNSNLFLVFVLWVSANNPRSTGKYKNWESFTVETDKGKVCFAQTLPTKNSGFHKKRELKVIVTFRPSENIKDEVSLTSGHDYIRLLLQVRKKRFSFFSQKKFAWLLDDQEEKTLLNLEKSNYLIVKARTINGAETTDHYSMMGFTKAYNTAKNLRLNEKNCFSLLWRS